MTGKMQRLRKLMYETLPEGKTGIVVGNSGRLPTCNGCRKVILDDKYIIKKENGILREYHENCISVIVSVEEARRYIEIGFIEDNRCCGNCQNLILHCNSHKTKDYCKNWKEKI